MSTFTKIQQKASDSYIQGNNFCITGPRDDPNQEESGMEEDANWGGDRRSGTGKKEYGNEYKASDLKNATSYEKGTNGKRQFKGG